MQQLKKYVIALTNLYGLAHRDTVIKVYNKQNKDHIYIEYLQKLVSQEEKSLYRKHGINVHQDYLVKNKIIERGTFDQELEFRQLLPMYIPYKEELLNYADYLHMEQSEEVVNLHNFLKGKYWYSGNKAARETYNIYMFCRSAREHEGIHDHLYNSPLKFESEEEILELAELIINLAYVTRVQEFNGYTPNELLDKSGRFPQELKKAIKKEFPVYAETLGIMSGV